MTADKGRVFLSYSWKDQKSVIQFRDALRIGGFDVWMDIDNIKPGAKFAREIEAGLNASDFYVIFLSDAATQSNWVRREISQAISLADKDKLTPIPVLLGDADVPIEFSGLLYIDARRALSDGINRLIEYLGAQNTKIKNLEKRMIVLKSDDPLVRARLDCQNVLRDLTPSDFRFHMNDRFDLTQVKTLWFDLFARKMEDEVHVINLSLAIIELLDRARRDEQLPDLIDTICRNYPKFSILIASIDPGRLKPLLSSKRHPQ